MGGETWTRPTPVNTVLDVNQMFITVLLNNRNIQAQTCDE